MSPLVRNVLSQYASRLVAIASSLFLFPFITYHVGLSQYGLWQLTSGIAAFFAQTDLGMGTSAIRYVAAVDPHSHNGLRRLNEVVGSTIAFFTALGVGMTTVFLLVIWISWDGFEVRAEDRHLLAVVIAIVAVGNLLIGLPLNPFRMILIGLHRMDVANGLLVAQSLVRVIAIVAVLLAGSEILGVVIADAAVVVATNLAAMACCRHLVSGLRFSWRLARRSVLREMLSYSAQVFVLGLSALVILQTNSYLIGLMLPVAFVTLYLGAWRIAFTLREITGTIMNAVLPEASRAWANGDRDRVRRLLVRGTKYGNALVLVVGVPVFVFAEPLLVVWAGDRFASSAILLQILLVGVVVGSNHVVALGLLLGVGRVRRFTLYHVIWAIANVGLALALVPSLKLKGMAVASTVPILVLEPFYVRTAVRELGMPLPDFLRGAVLPAFIPAVVATPILVVPGLLPAWTQAVTIAGATTLFGLVYAVVFARIGLDPGERLSLAQWVRSRRRAAAG